ncbi:hydrophobin [Daedalea quercina L-15889]|uniref:Hydrophobin n=1 Tax=Daedalea quercina L-15889 TaxID=1314783 RepID=A0A165NY59_9APHY|nr:hydrophobin [Daedalea quercina L-15889]
MFTKLFLSLLALSGAALAVPHSSRSAGQCNTGPIMCCNSVTPASNVDAPTSALLNSLNIVVTDILNNVGTGCLPLDGGDSCGSAPVCCENNNFNGLVNLGCSPVTVDT